jgi:hypothetical protein
MAPRHVAGASGAAIVEAVSRPGQSPVGTDTVDRKQMLRTCYVLERTRIEWDDSLTFYSRVTGLTFYSRVTGLTFYSRVTGLTFYSRVTALRRCHVRFLAAMAEIERVERQRKEVVHAPPDTEIRGPVRRV